VGELSNPYDDGVPELLRDYGGHKLAREELEAARRSLVGTAYERKFERDRHADPAMLEPARVTYNDLVAPIERLLEELPRRPDYSETLISQLVSSQASRILSAGGRRGWHDATGRFVTIERPKEAIEALKKLKKAARQLGPLAEQTLHLASELPSGENRLPHAFLVPSGFLLIDSIETAIDVLQPHVKQGVRSPGTGPGRSVRLADQVARAYAEVTGVSPPTTNPTDESTHPYHRLAQQVFSHRCFRPLPDWKDPTRAAARRLKKGRETSEIKPNCPPATVAAGE
jgi:hypothetical protein